MRSQGRLPGASEGFKGFAGVLVCEALSIYILPNYATLFDLISYLILYDFHKLTHLYFQTAYEHILLYYIIMTYLYSSVFHFIT